MELPSFPPCLSWPCQQPHSLDSTLASAALGADFSSKKSSGKTCPGQSLSLLGGAELGMFPPSRGVPTRNSGIQVLP